MRRFLMVVVLGALAGCSEPAVKGAKLDFARAVRQWESHRPVRYHYEVQVSCFCPYVELGPVRVAVLNDSVMSAVYVLNGEPADAELFGRYLTVDRLFETVWNALETADSVVAEYEPVYGVPVEVSIDRWLDAVDDELGFRVTAFVAHPPEER